MKPANYFLLLIACLFQIACNKPQLEYNTALDSCVPDTIRLFKEGDTDTIKIPEKGTRCIIGAQLPKFKSQTMDGKIIDGTYFSGKVSIINFWFEGCHPCEAEIPGFNKLVEKYKNEAVNFLAIGRNSPKDIKDFLGDHPFYFDHIAYGEPLIMGNFKSMWGYPLTIVADRNQKILYANAGGRDDSLAIGEIQKLLVPVIEKALGRG